MNCDRLAIEGGDPVWDQKLSAWPVFDEEMVAAASDVLRSGRVNYWTGTEGQQFEQEYAAALGVPFAIALSNGTVALELALKAIGLQPGDEVIVPARTFIATASSVVACGGRPVVADVDPETGNLTADSAQAVLTPRTRAIIPVHIAGCPCDMDPIMRLAEQQGLWVIEDCAQAHGALYRGRSVGTIGHLGAFSFCQDKILTTGGEGGLLVTADRRLHRTAWEYKDHGKNFGKACQTGHPPLFRYLHDSFGTNMRMTEMQAAIGRVMLRRLPQWVAQRREHARQLQVAFAEMPGIRLPNYPADIVHSYYKFYVYVDTAALAAGWSRDEIILAIQREGIPCGSGSCSEIHREQAFRKAGCVPTVPLPAAARMGGESLMFLVHPTLRREELQATVAAVRKTMLQATSRARHAARAA